MDKIDTPFNAIIVGTGAIGSALATAILLRDDSSRIVMMGRRSAGVPGDPRVTFVKFDASDPESIGIWSVQYEKYLLYGGTCKAYNEVPEIPPYQMDINLRVARAASVIAVVLGGLAIFGLVYYIANSSFSSSSSSSKTPMLGTAITVTFLFSWIAQGSTFTIYGTKYCSDDDQYGPIGGCDLHYGGLASASAFYFWFLAFLACKVANMKQQN